MRLKNIIKGFVAIAVSLSVMQCGASLNGVRSDLNIPNQDMNGLSSATLDANKHPHDVSTLIEFGEQLYGAEQYYKAYYQWDYVLKLDAENATAKEKIERGIRVLYYKRLENITSDADFNSKWNNQSWKVSLKAELDSGVFAKMVDKTNLPENVITSKATEVTFAASKMDIDELGIKYNGYVAYVVKKMPFFNQRELFRALEIEKNMSEGKYFEAAKAVHSVPDNFPHAKFEAEKLEVTVKEKWNEHLRSQKSMDFKYYDENKEALYSFIRFYQGSKEADKLKNYIEEMLYNYFNSTSITDLVSATEFYNNSRKFAQEFRNSKFKEKVVKTLEDKWARYLKSSASVIITSPERTKKEIFAFRNAFLSSNPTLVKTVEAELDSYLEKRYSGLSIADTADISKVYTVLKNYDVTFPSSVGYYSLKKNLEQKISSYIMSYKITNGAHLAEADAIYSGYRLNLPTSPYIPTIKAFLENKANELHEEAVKYYEMAKEAKEKNQYTLAARYVNKALEFEPNNLDAKSLSFSMSEYMEATSSFTTIVTSANDAETYDEAMKILNGFVKKYAEYGDLVKEVNGEIKRLKKFRKKWDKRQKNAFK